MKIEEIKFDSQALSLLRLPLMQNKIGLGKIGGQSQHSSPTPHAIESMDQKIITFPQNSLQNKSCKTS